MAIEYIKKSTNEKQRIDDNEKVKKIVENTLKEIELRGDEYIRELSKKFDNYSPTRFKLSEEEINKLINEVSEEDIDDIEVVDDDQIN